jgi:predicted permease
MSLMLRLGWRSLCRSPLLSAVVVACVGFGVGATATVFAWMDHLVRRPLPAVESVDRLASVVMRFRGREESLSYPVYLDLRDGATKLGGLTAFGLRQFGVRATDHEADQAASIWGVLVSDNYFDVLGIRAAAGRTFAPGESRTAGEAPVAVISHRLSRQRFGGAAGAIGRELRVNDVLFAVIGVAPPDFAGTYAGLSFDLWVPITMDTLLGGDSGVLDDRGFRWLQAFGRLGDGVTMAEAAAEMHAIGARLAQAHRADEPREAFLKPLDTGAAQRLENLFTILMGITCLLALIVCTNVANLLLLRGAARRFEIGICLAIGASRRWILLQQLTEAAVLALAGSLLGLFVARWGQSLLPAMMPPSPLPLALEGRLDMRLLAFVLALAAAMLAVFGVAPAIQSLRGSVLPHLGGGRAGASYGTTRLRAALVVAQSAFSLAALASAGVFLRANREIAALDRGLSRPNEVLLVSTDLHQAGYHSGEARALAVERLLSQVRALPGVRSASLATFVPLGFGGYGTATVAVPAYVPQPDEDMMVMTNRVASDYFSTAGVPIRLGRAIDERDRSASAPVVVVNEAFVRRFMTAGVVGSPITVGTRRLTVVGVAADGKYRFDALDEPSPPLVYLAYAQDSRASVTLHVRADGPPLALVPAVRGAFAALDPALPINSPTTLEEYTSLPLFPVRLGTAVLSSLGAIALVLASTGLYGVVAYRVSQRWRELAVRVALGASASGVRRLVLRAAAYQAATGVAIGTMLALLTVRVLSTRVPRASSVDPLVLATSAALLLVVCLIASLLPASRAARVDPAVALRSN